eukprot:SAG31_NODE_35892_length_318_cov_1.401826_2_plen_74_part_01
MLTARIEKSCAEQKRLYIAKANALAAATAAASTAAGTAKAGKRLPIPTEPPVHAVPHLSMKATANGKSSAERDT